MDILAYVILAHLIADFVLQSDGLVAKKKAYYNEKRKVFDTKNPLWIHGAYVFGCMQIVHIFYQQTLSIIIMTGLITVGHMIIDHIKLAYQNPKPRNEKVKFFVDQIAHLIVIIFGCGVFELDYEKKYISTFGNYSNMNNGKWWIPKIESEYIMVAIIFTLFSYVAGYVISFLLENLKVIKGNRDDEEHGEPSERRLSDSEKKTGIKIGIIERMLVIIFVAVGQYGAMGLILAGKSLARYEELKNKDFSEYYLYGTLLSFLFGIAGGLIINSVIPK